MKTYKGTVTPGEMNWEIYVDGKKLNPRYDLRNHSPSGFSYGYNGSGPAQAALAILADCLQDDELAQDLYQQFKSKVIARLDGDKGWEMTEEEVKKHVESI